MTLLEAAIDKAGQEAYTLVGVIGLVKEEVFQGRTDGLVGEVERVENVELGVLFGCNDGLGAIGRVLVLGMAAFGLLFLDVVCEVTEGLYPSQIRAVPQVAEHQGGEAHTDSPARRSCGDSLLYRSFRVAIVSNQKLDQAEMIVYILSVHLERKTWNIKVVGASTSPTLYIES